eukprot:scaffold12578_cov30-Tisochrysis_lutea.AAC.8
MHRTKCAAVPSRVADRSANDARKPATTVERVRAAVGRCDAPRSRTHDVVDGLLLSARKSVWRRSECEFASSTC